MQILFISPRQCWPPRSGAKLREYHFLRALAKRAAVTYLHFSEPGSTPVSRTDLPFCSDVVAVSKPQSYGLWNVFRGVFGRWPLPILNYTSPEMSAQVDRLMARTAYDLIHLDSIHMIRYGRQGPSGTTRPKLVYDWHNIESEAMRRFGQTVPSPAKRWYARQTAGKLEALESSILHTAFGHVVCSKRERDQLLQMVPQARIGIVENGVDTNFFAGAGGNGGAKHSGTNPRFVFVGTMDYYPNVEAATSFVTGVWPRIREALPDAQLAIVGANPTASVRALGEIAGITVTGTVPDVRPWYENALAAVVPLRTGGGTRLKILEAMAAGVPVVSTSLGAEGLAVTAGVDILLTEPDDAEGWIRHLHTLVESRTAREQIKQAALQLVRGRYDWEALGTILSDTYEVWLEEAK